MLWRLLYLLHLCGEDPINWRATWISLQFNIQWHHLGSLKWATIYMKEIGKCCTSGLDGFGWSDWHNRTVGKMLVMINRLSLKVCHVCDIVNHTEIEETVFQYLKAIWFNKAVVFMIDEKVIFYHVSLSFFFLFTYQCKKKKSTHLHPETILVHWLQSYIGGNYEGLAKINKNILWESFDCTDLW